MKLLVSIVFFVATSSALAANIDAALITQLQGDAVVESDKGTKRPAVALLKLAIGEKLQLKSVTKIQIVYFESGRQESWSGTGQVEIDSNEGKSTTLKPELKQLPPLLVKQLAKTPGAGQQGRAGMVVMRSLPTPAKVTKLESQYAEFRKGALQDDLTPEIYYLSGLIELKEIDRAKTVLSMLRTRKDEPGVQSVIEHFSGLTDSLGKPAQ